MRRDSHIMYSCMYCGLVLIMFNLQRGWTTWTTGIVDKRVIGIIPIVEDLLNINPVCARLHV